MSAIENLKTMFNQDLQALISNANAAAQRLEAELTDHTAAYLWLRKEADGAMLISWVDGKLNIVMVPMQNILVEGMSDLPLPAPTETPAAVEEPIDTSADNVTPLAVPQLAAE